MAGRRKEPIDLIAAKGRKHLTKAEYEERKNGEVIAPSDDIKAPSFLSKKEQKKFDEIADVLVDIGIMTNLDCEILGRYVKATTEYEKITAVLDKIKLRPDRKVNIPAEEQLEEQIGKFGYLQKVQDKCMRACNDCARELGLTISSRCRLVMPKKEEEKPKNKYDRFIG